MARPTREVENYTSAFLVMAGFVLFMAMMTLWVMFNFAASLVTGLLVHFVINRIPTKD